jgi:hypothetical protein
MISARDGGKSVPKQHLADCGIVAVCVDDERTKFITSIGTHQQRRKGRVLVWDLENLNWRIEQWRGLYHRVPLAMRRFGQWTLYLRTKQRVVSRPMVGRSPDVRLARANGMLPPDAHVANRLGALSRGSPFAMLVMQIARADAVDSGLHLAKIRPYPCPKQSARPERFPHFVITEPRHGSPLRGVLPL